MFDFLQQMAAALRRFLDRTLPATSANWWESCVFQKLSFQQQRLARERGFKTLEQLDLSALLRVLDQNWHELSCTENLPHEARHWLKELQTIRNRWAHLDGCEMPDDDIYRDLDTIGRLARVIGADEQLLGAIVEEKKHLRGQPAEAAPKKTEPEPVRGFLPGQMVRLRSDSKVQGVVVQVLPGETEDRYLVFCNNQATPFYTSQIEAANAPSSTPTPANLDTFHCALTARQLRQPSLAHLYSLHSARITYVPYQFRPVLRFIRAERPRLLIADEVGVGKTIEAGLILRECQARRDVRNVLILCPKSLVAERKWQLEMKRFDEEFTQLEGASLRYCLEQTHLDGVWPAQHARTIIPFSLLDDRLLFGGGRKARGLLDLDPPPHFDLVIVDEAHHARNPGTATHRCVRFFCEHADAVVFLSATPVQLGSHELFTLLHLLRPDLVLDWQSFQHMAEPNRFLHEAVNHLRAGSEECGLEAAEALRSAAETEWGRALLRERPNFQELYDRLQAGSLAPEERIGLIHRIEALNSFAGLINRTRRRDIGAFTVRQAVTENVPFTEVQRALHDAVLATQQQILSLVHERGIAFMMTTIRRQAASCLFGLAPMLRSVLSRRLDTLEQETDETDAPTVSPDAIEKIRARIERIAVMAEQLPPEDPKLERLRTIIIEKQARPNNKLLLFTSFLHTLHYLEEKLDGVARMAVIYGGVPDFQRADIRRRFWLPKEDPEALDLLLCSEVGAEGLDYQCCDCLVNYDLPWNPARVEQRIGRIDRYGQQSEAVAIYNFITPGTVDFDIYERCLMRIGVFRQALGGSEEILGELTDKIRRVAESLELSTEDRVRQLQQLADNEVRLIQEQQALEEREQELFGVRLPPREQEQAVKDATSFWLQPARLQALIEHYLRQVCGPESTPITGEGPLKTLRLNQDARRRLLAEMPASSSRPLSAVAREWKEWLQGTEANLALAFDSATAAGNRRAAFITPIHPLAQQAASALEAGTALHTTCEVTDAEAPSGTFPFAIYQWRKHGGREDTVLQAVTTQAGLAGRLVALLAKARPATGVASPPDTATTSRLDAAHHALWSAARAEHIERTRQLALARRESLEASHRARIRLLEEQLAATDDPKIRRMRTSQLARAGADYERHVAELDTAATKADLTAEPIAFGTLLIHTAPDDAASP